MVETEAEPGSGNQWRAETATHGGSYGRFKRAGDTGRGVTGEPVDRAPGTSWLRRWLRGH